MINGYYAIDYQVHSLRSHDGKVSIMDMCERAVDIGLDEIGFSEHKDFDPQDPVVEYFNYDLYMKEITEARNYWGNRLKIRAGVEIDYQIWFEDEIAAYLQMYEFDFVLGSVHYVDRVKVMCEEYNRTRDVRKAYTDYFRAARDSVMSGLFDVLAHLEYANRLGVSAWGRFSTQPYEDELISIFQAMSSKNTVLEINTAGIFHGIGATYPSKETLILYGKCGGDRISIGSDAHHPNQLGGNYAAAVETGLAAGISNLITWDKRQATAIPLGQM